jgi:hypothetical protein
MARKASFCTLSWTVGVLLAATVVCPLIPKTLAAPRQDQQDVSVVDAARKARADRKAGPQTAKVYTNDDVTNLKGIINVVGPAPATPDIKEAGAGASKDADKASADAGTDATPAAALPKDEAGWRKAFADGRKKLADDAKELDILQREFNLKQEQFYTDPNASLKEEYSRDDLKKTQAQIDQKKMDVDADKQAISDLTDELRESGGDAGWGREPN